MAAQDALPAAVPAFPGLSALQQTTFGNHGPDAAVPCRPVSFTESASFASS